MGEKEFLSWNVLYLHPKSAHPDTYVRVGMGEIMKQKVFDGVEERRVLQEKAAAVERISNIDLVPSALTEIYFLSSSTPSTLGSFYLLLPFKRPKGFTP